MSYAIIGKISPSQHSTAVLIATGAFAPYIRNEPFRTRRFTQKAKLPAKDSYVQILALFAASPGKSFTATDVYQHLIATDPDVNVTSIYRIVRSLHMASLLDCDKGSAGYGGGKNVFRIAAGVPAVEKIRGRAPAA